MQFASLGSGSKGNATVVRTQEVTILIDCGFSLRQTQIRLERLGLTVGDIDAILVSHEHSDHVFGVPALAKSCSIPVWASRGTISSGRLERLEGKVINLHQTFHIGDLVITPVAVPHDAREPCQFTFENKSHGKLGVLTDVGHITKHIVDNFNDCDALLLEANHDADMLSNGGYPQVLKRRVSGKLGHLSNFQAAELVKSVDLKRLKKLVLAHLSEKNNTPDIANSEICKSLGCAVNFPIVASQQEGVDWVSLI